MTWNYRVMRSYPAGKDDAWYSIREVFYDNYGNINGWTKCEIAPNGETLEELLAVIEKMHKCLFKPILDEAELEARNDKSR